LFIWVLLLTSDGDEAGVGITKLLRWVTAFVKPNVPPDAVSDSVRDEPAV